MSRFTSAQATPVREEGSETPASTISMMDLAAILESIDWDSVSFGGDDDERARMAPIPEASEEAEAATTTPLKTAAPQTVSSPAIDTTPSSGTKRADSQQLHRLLCTATAVRFRELLPRLRQLQLVLPRLSDAPILLQDVDAINHEALQLLCTPGSLENRSFLGMLQNILDSNQREQRKGGAKMMSKTKFFEHLYFVVPVHSQKAKKEDRHARNAIRLLLAGFALAEMHGTGQLHSEPHTKLLAEFESFYPQWQQDHSDIVAPMGAKSLHTDFSEETIFRIYCLFREVYQIIPLKNNLELCLLLLSVVEGGGVHRQRGGHMTKADQLYRDVLETLASYLNVA